MKRLKTIGTTICALLIATSPTYAQQNEQTEKQLLLDQYLKEIESLISANQLEAARDKLAEASANDLRDESLEIIYSQLRLLESINDSKPEPAISAAIAGELTDRDKLAAVDLLDSLRVAMENGQLDQVRRFTDATPQTESLLNAVFENYSAMKIEVSAPEADNDGASFLATLKFKELTTTDGNTAFPADAWKTHRLRIIKSEGVWQKVLW